jgi:ketosteroid isomerase-like protein
VSAERNKAVARRLFERFTASDIPGVMALMTDGATWRIPGKKELTPTAGVYSRKNIEKLFRRMLEALEGGLRMTATSVIAEGDKVAVEAVSEGDLKNGRRYRQEYHFLLEFRDGRISAVREYLDTQHAHDVWIRAG